MHKCVALITIPYTHVPASNSMVHDRNSDQRAPPAPPRPSSTRLQGPGIVHKRTMLITRDSKLTTTMTAHCKGDDGGVVQTPDSDDDNSAHAKGHGERERHGTVKTCNSVVTTMGTAQ